MSKKEAPPTTPKVGGKSGISFSFKALEEEEDEELIVLTEESEKHSKLTEKNIKEYEKVHTHSVSPDLKVGSNIKFEKKGSMTRQYSLEKLREKLQDTISKKLDEFSAELPSKTSKENSPELVNVMKSEQKLSSGQTNPRTNNETGVTRQPYHDLSTDSDCFVDPTDDSISSTNQAEEGKENVMEIHEDYYNPDAEDLLDSPGVFSTVRERKRLQKSEEIKTRTPPSPIAKSKLNSSLPGSIDGKQTEMKKADEMKKQDTESPKLSEHEKRKAAVFEFFNTFSSTKVFVISSIVILIFQIMPLPSYISGMVMGIFLSSGVWLLYLWITKPPRPREIIQEDIAQHRLPPLPIPEMKEAKGEDCSYKGWMNEITEYSPDTYSINQTHSVYVHLDGTSLRLRRPKVNVPKRAIWDQPTQTAQFVHQRHFELEGSKVLVVPAGLVKKRLWSKKYPICISLGRNGKKSFFNNEISSSVSRTSNQSPSRMKVSKSVDALHGFEFVGEQHCQTSVLYLFARTCHEKEQWFRRLKSASLGTPLKNHIYEVQRILNAPVLYRHSSSTDSLKQKQQESLDSSPTIPTNSSLVEEAPILNYELKEFVMYMSRLVPRNKDSLPSTDKDSKGSDAKLGAYGVPRGIICDPGLLPLNALIGRCFWDFLRDQYWQEKVKDKLQKKLSKIHIPFFIEELKISDIDLGSEVPVIRRTYKPYLDENGFWIDLDLTYSGKCKMTIETKVNLLKLKQTTATVKNSKEKSEKKKSAVTDSDEEDSAESSTDEEDETTSSDEGGLQQGGRQRGFMKYINKITASKYFQSATDNKYIKKAMTGVSNTPLILTVEVQKLNGTLAINIPPPPTDRLWYGFRGNPQMWLVAKPKVGEREVTMSHITEWIEKKLTSEFQLVLVMPNMDDLVIPILRQGENVSCSVPQPSNSEV